MNWVAVQVKKIIGAGRAASSSWLPGQAGQTTLAQPGAARSGQAAGEARLYHYQIEAPGEKTRAHLRIDPDGSGVLLINASRVLHLNPTAAAMAHLALEKTPEAQAIQAIRAAYTVSRQQAASDYQAFNQQLTELLRPDGACPLHDLDLEIAAPFSARPSAPYRMDLALTYRCNNDCAHCYNPRSSSSRRPNGEASSPSLVIGTQANELDTADWKRILDQLWAIGVPHIIFTGGEPTLRADLAGLIAYAEGLGQITGLNTNARRLHDSRYLQSLVDAGLDHVQITVESHDPAIHDQMVACHGAWQQTIAGLQNALQSRLYVMTNTTLLQENSPYLGETLDFLARLGVPTVGLNALIYSGRGAVVGSGIPEKDLPPLLEVARAKTEAQRQRLIWYTPTQYCHFDPMQLDLGVKGCTAALYNMCIEPNGDVLPCQSYYHALGNLLCDPWESIWQHDLSISLRERRLIEAKCQDCALLSECGGGCPLTIEKTIPDFKTRCAPDSKRSTE